MELKNLTWLSSDSGNAAPLPNASVQLFMPTDSSFTTPMPIFKDSAGSTGWPGNTAISDLYGLTAIAVADGTYVVRAISQDGSLQKTVQDQWVDALVLSQSLGSAVQSAQNSANSASANAGVASAGATTAAAQAATATTQAGLATTAATNAAASATAAQTGTPNRAQVRVAIMAALPANTYSNGSSGVGATLTAAANGALPSQDGIALNAADRVWIGAEAASANNGLYTLTQAGDSTHPYIFTRATDANTAAGLGFSCALVSAGTVYAGYSMRVTNDPSTLVVGTTAVSVVASSSTAGVAGEAAARAAAITAVHSVLDPLAMQVSTQNSARSGGVAKRLDKNGKKLSEINIATDVQWQYLEHHFTQRVSVDLDLVVGGAVRTGSAVLSNRSITYMPRSARSGAIWRKTDNSGKVVIEQLVKDGSVWAWNKRLLTTDDLAGITDIGNSYTEGGTGGTTYAVLTGKVGGFRQVYVRNLSTDVTARVSALGCNNWSPRIVGNNVVYATDRANAPPNGLMFVALGTAVEIPAVATPNIGSFIGDSLTAGAGASAGHAWPTQFGALVGGGYTVLNDGYGGRQSGHIAALIGALQTTLNASGNSVAGAGATTSISNVSTNLLWLPSDGTMTSVGTIIGAAGATIHGTLIGVTSSGVLTYSFTSDLSAATISCPAGSQFVPDLMANTRDTELHICVGRNDARDSASVAATKANITAIVNFARPLFKKITLYDILNGNYVGEYSGTANHDAIVSINTWMQTTFPQYYAVDNQGRGLRVSLVNAYNPSLALDVIAFNNDTVPSSLHAMGSQIATLSTAISTTPAAGTVETITLSSPATVNHVLQIDSELFGVTAVSGNNATVIRGYAGSTAATHAANASVLQEDSIHGNDTMYSNWAQVAYTSRNARGYNLV